MSLKLRQRLETPNKAISHVVFPEIGVVSVVARESGDHHIEVGIIGREGMTGLPVIMGTDRSPNDTYIQISGEGWRIEAAHLRNALHRSSSLARAFQLFIHVFLIQASHTALANGRATIEERLARWLLMAQDRMDGDKLTLTHEFLATMLGVRRAGVTIAMGALQAEGLIATSRGTITILDRKGLLKRTNGYFGAPEREWRRIYDNA
ncbi:MAG: Crp/Fnr family transcriptional regulator [Hyphomicrobium sp.]